MHKNILNGETLRPDQIKSVSWYVSRTKAQTHSLYLALTTLCSQKVTRERKMKRMMLDRMESSLDLRTVMKLQVDLKMLMRRLLTKEQRVFFKL